MSEYYAYQDLINNNNNNSNNNNNNNNNNSNNNNNNNQDNANHHVDLADVYLSRDDIDELIKKFENVPVSHLTFNSVVLSDANHSLSQLAERLHEFVKEKAQSLQVLILKGSNASGRIFYKGERFEVENPEKVHVTVESVDANGDPIVRDDSPEKLTSQNDIDYHYLKTSFIGNKFYRYFVELNWLKKLRIVDVSGCTLSGYGLTSIVAAACESIQVLVVKNCADVSDEGIVALTEMCTSLRWLDISNCKKLTKHGIMYLQEMDSSYIPLIERIDITNEIVDTKFAKAVLHGLEQRGFRGALYYGGSQPLQGDPSVSIVRHHYATHPGRIVDLSMTDITPEVLSIDETGQRANGVALDLSNHLINNMVLNEILARWGKQLYSLNLSGTYITETGLSHLSLCPYIAVLNLSKCWNLTNKSAANHAVMPAIKQMTNLVQLDISDTRLSGRMLSENRNIRLRKLNASRCPMSVHAIRLLTETSSQTMEDLELSGCRFLNTKAVHYFLRFSSLKTLDLSYCGGISADAIMLFHSIHGTYLRNLQEIDITGIHGLREVKVRELANQLTKKTPDQHVVSIIWAPTDESNSQPKRFAGEFLFNDCRYVTLTDSLNFARKKNNVNSDLINSAVAASIKYVKLDGTEVLAGNRSSNNKKADYLRFGERDIARPHREEKQQQQRPEEKKHSYDIFESADVAIPHDDFDDEVIEDRHDDDQNNIYDNYAMVNAEDLRASRNNNVSEVFDEAKHMEDENDGPT